MVPTTRRAIILNIQMDMVEMYIKRKKMDKKKEAKERFITRQRKEMGEKPRFLETNVFTF